MTMPKNEGQGLSLDTQIAQWSEEALGDEEHVAITARFVHGMLMEPGSTVVKDIQAGRITLEAVARFSSLLISIETTDRNYGGAPAVAQAVLRILPPDILNI